MPARPFTPSELSILEAHLLAARRLRDRMLLIFGTNVGYRIRELVTLTMGQVLTQEGNVARKVSVARALLKIGTGKRRKSIRSRRVVLNERARGAIRDYIASLDRMPLPEDYLFQSRQGGNRPISRSQALRIMVGMCQECGIDTTRISSHSLGMSFTRAVYDVTKGDLPAVQRIIGHSSPMITARYLESTQAEFDAVVLGLAGTPAPSLGFAL